jgi:hypothetical protein
VSDEIKKTDAVYYVDAERFGTSTGIKVRARFGEKWGSYDIGELTRGSLMDWLRSRGGSNPWAEQTVAILLGWE